MCADCRCSLTLKETYYILATVFFVWSRVTDVFITASDNQGGVKRRNRVPLSYALFLVRRRDKSLLEKVKH